LWTKRTSPGHFAPGGLAHATISFRQLPAAAFPLAAYAFEEVPSRGHVSLAPRSRQPSRQNDAFGENMGNSSLNALDPGMLLDKPGRETP
jgi:hypothetical protein